MFCGIIKFMGNALRRQCLFTVLVACLIAAMTGCTALRPGLCKTPERPAIERIQDLGLLRVGSTGDYRPLTWLDLETGRWEGFDIDVAERIAAELGVRVEFVQTSWPTLSADVQSNPPIFDLAIGGITVTDVRRASMAMSMMTGRWSDCW